MTDQALANLRRVNDFQQPLALLAIANGERTAARTVELRKRALDACQKQPPDSPPGTARLHCLVRLLHAAEGYGTGEFAELVRQELRGNGAGCVLPQTEVGRLSMSRELLQTANDARTEQDALLIWQAAMQSVASLGAFQPDHTSVVTPLDDWAALLTAIPPRGALPPYDTIRPSLRAYRPPAISWVTGFHILRFTDS